MIDRENIKAILKKYRLTYADLADKSGVSPSLISLLLSGKHKHTSTTIAMSLAKALKVPIEEIIANPSLEGSADLNIIYHLLNEEQKSLNSGFEIREPPSETQENKVTISDFAIHCCLNGIKELRLQIKELQITIAAMRVDKEKEKLRIEAAAVPDNGFLTTGHICALFFIHSNTWYRYLKEFPKPPTRFLDRGSGVYRKSSVIAFMRRIGKYSRSEKARDE